MPIPTSAEHLRGVKVSPQRPLDDWLEMCLKDQPNPMSSLDLLENGGIYHQKINQMNQKNGDLNGSPNPFYLYPTPRHHHPSINPHLSASNYLNRNLMMRNPNLLQAHLNPDYTSLPPIINYDHQISDSLIPNAGQPVDLLESKAPRNLNIPSPNDTADKRR